MIVVFTSPTFPLLSFNSLLSSHFITDLCFTFFQLQDLKKIQQNDTKASAQFQTIHMVRCLYAHRIGRNRMKLFLYGARGTRTRRRRGKVCSDLLAAWLRATGVLRP